MAGAETGGSGGSGGSETGGSGGTVTGGSGGMGGACADPEVECSGECVDTDNDSDHCGECDNVCDSGSSCSAGQCLVNCLGGLLACDAQCINPDFDARFCGATDCSDAATSGDECEANERCVNGVCGAAPVGWGSPALLDDGLASAVVPDVAMDGAGRAVVVWRQSDGVNPRVYFAAWDPAATSWSQPKAIPGAVSASDGIPFVAASAGRAIAVWRGADDAAYAARLDIAAGTWSSPLSISDATGAIEFPSLAMDQNGNAIVTWAQLEPSSTTMQSVWWNYYDARENAWEGPEVLDTSTDGTSSMTQVVVDGMGFATAVWGESVDASSLPDIHAARLDPATKTWTQQGVISEEPTVGSYLPALAVDSTGEVTAVWYDRSFQVSASRFDGAWSSPTVLNGTNPGSDRYPVAAAASMGRAMAIWQRDADPNTATRAGSIIGASHDAMDGWADAAAIESSSTLFELPEIAADSGGNFYAVWLAADGDRGVWSNRFDASTGTWDGELEIDNVSGVASSAHISADATLSSVAVWSQGARVYAAVYPTTQGQN